MKTTTATRKPAAKASAAKKTTSTGKVKPKRTAAEGLRDLFVDELRDIYWAEKALVKALPMMAKNATTPMLASAIVTHLHETETHVERLEKIFSIFGEKAVAKKCDAMEGLLKEGEGILEDTEPGPVRDAGIILAAQKVEHYEIATYGTLVAFAGTLGELEAAELLKETLNEEKQADSTLTHAAYNNINFEAEQADEH
jgi:ferritin-like metal-binding protein YciE